MQDIKDKERVTPFCGEEWIKRMSIVLDVRDWDTTKITNFLAAFIHLSTKAD